MMHSESRPLLQPVLIVASFIIVHKNIFFHTGSIVKPDIRVRSETLSHQTVLAL